LSEIATALADDDSDTQRCFANIKTLGKEPLD